MPEADGLQSVLAQAAKLKEAQLKSRPSRQTWEQAPDFFKWTCGDYPHVLSARALTTFPERLSAAEAIKEDGNQRFVEDKLEDALQKYSNAIAVFLWFQRANGRSIEDVPLCDALTTLEAPELQQAERHLTACFVNAAAVLLKLRDSRSVIYACTKALSYCPDNAKALYRRAQANYALDTTYDLELAVKDLQRAAKLAPDDAAVSKCLSKWKAELVVQTTKDKRTFANMFRRGNLYQDADQQAAGRDLAGTPDPGLGWVKPPFCDDARRQAAEMGIDLEDPTVLEALNQLHQQKVDANDMGAAGQVAGGLAQLANPERYMEWWRALLAGRLRWRWHYLIYIFLWGHAGLRTYKIVQQFSQQAPANGHLDAEDDLAYAEALEL